MKPSFPARRFGAMFKPLALAAGVLLAAALPAAEAGVIVQTATFATGADFREKLTTEKSPFGKELTGKVSNGDEVSFKRFDPTLGTLKSVTWELVGAAYSFDVVNRAEVTPAPLSLVYQFDLRALLDGFAEVGGGKLLGAGTGFQLGVGGTAKCGLGFNPLGWPGSPGCGERSVDSALVLLKSMGADVSEFIGTDSFVEEVAAGLKWSDRIDLAFGSVIPGLTVPPPVLGPGPAEIFGRFDFTGALRLTYNYEAAPPAGVPEPGTLWMVAGLLPLLVLRGRRHGR